MKKEERKVVGAYLPLHIINFISLFALNMETGKSAIIRDLIEYWYKEKKELFHEEQMTKDLGNKFQNIWDGKKAVLPPNSWENGFTIFKKEIFFLLQKKGCEVYAEQIINKLRF